MAVAHAAKLAVPFDPHVWLSERKARLADGLARLGCAARSGTIPHGSIEDGTLRIDRSERGRVQRADVGLSRSPKGNH
jgi:hypothetical protein